MPLSHVLLLMKRDPLKAAKPQRRLGGRGVRAAMAAARHHSPQPSSAGISQEIMNGMTGQANAWGRPAIGCPETRLLSCEKVGKEKSPQDTRPTWGKFPTRTRSVSMPQLVMGVGRRLYPSV